MNKRRRRSNPWLIAFLLLVIGFFVYLNIYVVPTIPAPFVPTATPTRDPKSYAQEAEAYLAEGKSALAIESFEAAIKADPQEVFNYLTLAKLQIYNSDYEGAQINAENALLLDKTKPQAFSLLAWTEGYMGEYLEAEADVKEALAIDPNNAFAHAVYALILVMRVENDVGELTTLDTAIDQSQLAISLDSQLLESRWARGYVLEITANYEEAIEQYQIAVETNDSIADLHLALGRNYLAIEENDQAVFEFTKAYSLNPTDPVPNWYISRVYARIGEFAKAVQYAEQAVKDAPSDPYMHGNLGTMYYKDLQYNQAIASLEFAVKGGTTEDGVVVEGLPLEYSTSITEYYSRYGLSLARVNRCSDAVQVAQAMLQTVPDDETSVYNAEEIIRICQESQGMSLTPTVAPEGEEEDAGAADESMPTPTPTSEE